MYLEKKIQGEIIFQNSTYPPFHFKIFWALSRGGGQQNKIFEFQAPHSPWTWVFLRHVETLFILLVPHFCPSLGQKTTLQTAQKPNGGPLDEKTLFFKNIFWSFSNVFQLTTFTVLIPKTYQTPCYVCFWNQHNKCSNFNHVC